MKAGPPRYLAYLLRLWQVVGEGEPVWRASLEHAHTGERHGFSTLGALVAFLEEQIGTEPAGQAASSGLEDEESGQAQ